MLARITILRHGQDGPFSYCYTASGDQDDVTLYDDAGAPVRCGLRDATAAEAYAREHAYGLKEKRAPRPLADIRTGRSCQTGY